MLKNSNKTMQIEGYKQAMHIAGNEMLCCAPAGNMLFQPDGTVYACHYNRGYALGKYPDQSIAEIWNGRKRQKLADSLAKNKFEVGCDNCSYNIEHKLYHLADCYKYQFLQPDLDRKPLQMEFQLSNQCNYECMVCSGEYSSKLRAKREHLEPLPNYYNNTFADEIVPYLKTLKYAGFTGGEPFLNNTYYEIWRKIKAINPAIQISISTNGSIWNNDIENLLSQLHINMVVSIDSLNENLYSSVRKNGHLPTVLHNVDAILDFSNRNPTQLAVKFLIMPATIAAIPELFHYFNNKNIPLIPKFVYHPLLASMQILPTGEIAKAIDLLLKHQSTIEHSSNIQQNNFNKYSNVIEQLQLWQKHSKHDDFSQLNRLSTEELLVEIKKTIRNTTTQNMFSWQHHLAVIHCMQTLDYLVENTPNYDMLKKALIGMLLLPAQLVRNELQRNNKQNVLSRFLQNAQIEVDNYSIENFASHYKP